VQKMSLSSEASNATKTTDKTQIIVDIISDPN